MPKRSEIQAARIESMPVIPADTLCNARHGHGESGRCKWPAGYKTDHVGEGRCWIHGGNSGATISNGLYTEKYTSTLKAEHNKLQSDPAFFSLTSELVAMRIALGGIIQSLSQQTDDGSNPYVSYNDKGTPIIAPEAKLLIELTKGVTTLLSTISRIEKDSKHTLTIRDINAFVKQFADAMNVTCGQCPVRKTFLAKVDLIKVAPTQSVIQQ